MIRLFKQRRWALLRRLAVLWVASNYAASADPCTYALDPVGRTHGYAAEFATFNVTAPAECNWTVDNNSDWLEIKLTTNGMGSGTVRYGVFVNPNPVARTGALTVNGQSFTVTQMAAPCSFSILPAKYLFGAGAGSGNLTIFAADGCAWDVSSTNLWITITSPLSGIGGAVVSYSVAPNYTAADRIGIVRIADQSFTVMQFGNACHYTLTPSNSFHSVAAGTGSVSVSTSTRCLWDLINTNDWITLGSVQSRSGSGSVPYFITANPSSIARTGFLSIANQVLTIGQAGLLCNPLLSPSSRLHSSALETGFIVVTAPIGCHWTVQTASSWIIPTSSPTGVSNGIVSYQVAENPGRARTGTLFVNGAPFAITQGEALPAIILSAPSSQNVQAGASVVFNVSATGTAPLNYQWQWNGANLTEGPLVSGTTTPRLVLPRAQSWQSGTYAVVVGNIRGPVTSAPPAVLAVNSPPILAPIGNKTISQGAPLVVSASATDEDIPLQILSYSLDSGAPNGASLDPATGLFTWGGAQVPGSNRVTIRVTDNGVPPLSAAQSFNINVLTASVSNLTLVATGSVWRYRDTGEDLGTAWNVPTFDDSNWKNGPARLGYGSGSEATMVSYGPSSSARYLTTYFRTAFTVPDPFVFSALNLRALRNDGVVVYLNGVEIHRDNMPSGPINAHTRAASSVSSSARTTYFSGPPAAPGSLVPGQNVIAVEVHKRSPGGSVLGFDLELGGNRNFISPAVLVQPQSQSVPAGGSAVLSVTALGALPLRHQWYFKGTLLPDATNSTLVLATVPISKSGAYSVLVTNLLGSASSAVATLTVVPNSPPVLALPGDQTVNEGALLTFMASASDSDLPAQTFTFSLGPGAPSGAAINPTNGVFTWTPTEAQGPSTNAVTIQVTDSGFPALSDLQTITLIVNEVNTAPVLVSLANKTINEGNLLTFVASASDSDLPAQLLSYSLEPGAPSGATIDPATGVFTWTPSEAQGPSTNLVAIRVTDNGSPPLSGLATLSIVVTEVNSAPVLAPIGDKAVIKGSLLSFSAAASDADIPVQKLTYSLAPGAPSAASINPTTGLFLFTATNAQALSTNTVTLRVTDNGSPVLSDAKTFTVFVVAGVATNLSLIATGAVWKYRDTGEDLGTAWIAPAFNDTAWKSGPGVLGYGTGDESTIVSYGPNSSGKYTTTYFRRVFNVADPSLFNSLALRVRRDDGAVIYLNGVEVFRDNMPPGPINYLTPALASVSGADKISYHLSPPLDPSNLIIGTNLAAIEIHQRSAGSSAMDFDLELIGTIAKPNNAPPVLARIGDKTVLDGSSLSFTASATDPDVPAQSLTYSLDAGAPLGAGINPQNGSFIWAPSPSALPGTNQVTIRVTDSGAPGLSDSETISIVTKELTFAVATTNGPPGTEVSVPILVNSFSGINSFQFSLHWNPTLAAFLGVEQIALPGIGFGTPASDGSLGVSWDDPSGLSESLADGMTLFSLQLLLFDVPGASSSLWIDSSPTVLEAANGNLQLVPVATSPGQVTIDNLTSSNAMPLIAKSPPLINIAVNPGGEVSVGWITTPGKTYQVQYTTNLATHDWIDLGDHLIATGLKTSATDAGHGTRQRFYRVKQLSP